jgi:hypothetical protein
MYSAAADWQIRYRVFRRCKRSSEPLKDGRRVRIEVIVSEQIEMLLVDTCLRAVPTFSGIAVWLPKT